METHHITAIGTLIGTINGSLYLADRVQASYPPGVGSGIRVTGIPLDQLLPLVERNGDRFWSSEARVCGSVVDGVLVADRALVCGHQLLVG
ncbi:MAG: hypothetical protein ABI862_21750 [Ilumatobacteraceae bacterium]